MSEYPEHDKLAKVSQLRQSCSELLQWLYDEKHLRLADDDWNKVPEEELDDLVADFFGIDLQRLSKESRELRTLDYL